jgi:hypothetical protein
MPLRAENIPDPAAPQPVADDADRTDPDPLPRIVAPAAPARAPAAGPPLAPPPVTRQPPPVPLGGRPGAWSRRRTVVSDVSALLAADMDKIADGDAGVAGAVPNEGPTDDYIVEVVAPDPRYRK